VRGGKGASNGSGLGASSQRDDEEGLIPRALVIVWAKGGEQGGCTGVSKERPCQGASLQRQAASWGRPLTIDPLPRATHPWGLTKAPPLPSPAELNRSRIAATRVPHLGVRGRCGEAGWDTQGF
jgi:hypothetical protein